MSIRYPLLAAGLLFASTAIAEDWPQWRGPDRTGISKETGLLKSWPKDGPTLVWTAKNLGNGWGTPSVADGKIFGIGTREGKDGVWALKETDGSELWFTPFADPPAAKSVGGQTNGPGSTPTYSKGKVYAVSHNGTVVALDATNGKKSWTKSYISDFGGSLPRWGFNDSVLIDEDKVICAPGGPKAALAALKADTGATIWTTDAGDVSGGQGYSSPIKATIGNVPMYIILTGAKGGIMGVNAKTGKMLWKYNNTPAAGGVAQIPTPLVMGDLVWVSCSYGGGSALIQITSSGKDKFDVKEIKAYKKPELNNHHCGMVQVGDYIYFGHDQNKGFPVCVEFKTGAIKWGPEKNPAGADGSAAVVFADGRLYFRYQNGMLVLIEPSPDELKVVSSFKLPAPSEKGYPQSWPHPVVANGKLYIRDQNAMYCYNVKADKN
ncbi:MAG: PQQ-binding-like beta-propeller repeat protein [Planctomycetes bacterium]|nr:PQQ-binding-like beta-propeller repeat protein [Planctomycetota bacterium]